MFNYPVRTIFIDYNPAVPETPVYSQSGSSRNRNVAQFNAIKCFENLFYMREKTQDSFTNNMIEYFYKNSEVYAVSSFTKDANNDILTYAPSKSEIILAEWKSDNSHSYL